MTTDGKDKNLKSQADRFIETARKLGTDKNEVAFRERLAVIARQKPKQDVPRPPRGDES